MPQFLKRLTSRLRLRRRGARSRRRLAQMEPLETRSLLASLHVDLGIFSLPERSAEDSVVGQVSATGGIGPVSYQITGGNSDLDGDRREPFKIDTNSGTVLVNDPNDLDFSVQSTFVLTVTATDSTLATDSGSQVVFLIDLNDPPEFNELEVLHVAENSDNHTLVGSVTATDRDGDLLTYDLTGVGNTDGPDDDSTPPFAIDPQTGAITLIDADELNHEANSEVSLEIRATDNSPDAFTGTALITIEVGNENDTPMIPAQTLSVPEASVDGFSVGEVLAFDEDVDDALLFFLTERAENDVDGDGEPPFAISAEGQLLVNDRDDLDFELRESFELDVTVADIALASASAVVTVDVINIPEGEILLPDQSFTVVEGQESGSLVGELDGPFTEGDPPSFTYAITAGNPDFNGSAGPALSIDEVTGSLFVNDSLDLSQDFAQEFQLTVRATPGEGNWDPPYAEANVTIGVERIFVLLSEHSDFDSALSSIGGTNAKLVVDHHHELVRDVEVPSNVLLSISETGSLTLGPWQLAVGGGFESAAVGVFDTPEVTFKSGSAEGLRARWWRGSDNDSIKNALKSATISEVKRVTLDGEFTLEKNVRFASEEYSGITVSGEGPSTIVHTNSTDQLGILSFEVDGRDARITDLTFENFTLDGNNAFGSQGVYVWHGHGSNGVYGLKVRSMTARNFGKTGFYLAGNVEGSDLISHDNGLHGFVARDGHVRLENVEAMRNLIGLDIAGGRLGFETVATTRNFSFYENRAFGAKLGIIGSPHITANFFDGEFRDNSGKGFTSTFEVEEDFNDIFVNMTRVTANRNVGTGMQMKAGVSRLLDVVANSNTVLGIGAGGKMTIGDNITVSDNGQMGIFGADCQISNLNADSNHGEGVRLTTGTCFISHASIKDNAGYGIRAHESNLVLQKADFGDNVERQATQIGAWSGTVVLTEDTTGLAVETDSTSFVTAVGSGEPAPAQIVPVIGTISSVPDASSLTAVVRAVDSQGEQIQEHHIELSTLETRLDGQFQFYRTGSDFFNAFGASEKWLRSAADNRWYFLLPTNELYRWDQSGSASGTLVGQLSEGVHSNPSLLTEAQVPASAEVVDGVLTVTKDADFFGDIRVVHSVAHNDQTTDQTFSVRFQ